MCALPLMPRSGNHQLVRLWHRRLYGRGWGFDDHDRTAGQAYDLLGHTPKQQMLQPRAPVRPHHDQIATKFIEYVKDVPSAWPVGHDHLMLDRDLAVRRLNVVKPVPQVYRICLARIGKKFSAFRNHRGRVGDMEEDYFGSNSHRQL